uniref:Uncharacterized protein n=1 Tax=Anopheles culicifacies TaxID=139723 RepID=A0A182M2K6_9DIPT
MSFIDRIIADEAMRMLSAASSREATSLNEPCQEATEILPSSAPVSEGTEAAKQQEENVVNASKLADKAAKVSAADSALLQKSAEQVTKKLINQLSTMNKYDLKQMIDNPAGKYETALNKHAQSKLRAEVRKQLKGFALGKLGSAFVHGDGTVESDEAIDADKIPSALLEQIGHVLDLDIFNISQTVSPESIEQLPEVLESAPSKSKNEPKEPTVESKEDIERIASPQTILERMTDEYILGGDSGNAIQPEIQAQQAANHSATPLPSHCTERLQSLCGVIEHMQSIEAQTMELYNRKMAIDALFMQLHTERMDIDQRLERLHNIRREQMNFMRHNLLELATNNSSIESTMQPPSFVMSDSGLAGLNGAVPANQAAGGRQQERTIRRITPIGGNSVLMKIFQRRRAPSERSTDENPPVDLT